MDKNTVLAFVLMGIVLIGMPYYNDFFFPQEPVTEQVETERTAPDQDRDPQQSTPPVMQEEMQSSDQLAAKPETVSEKPASETKERLPESTIHVSSPLYSGKITTRGGVISSWNIDAYENRSGGPVAMVDPGKRANLGISFRTMDGDTVHSIQNDFYLVGRDSRSEHRLTVNPDNQETITLRCDLDEQRYIEKRYTFFGDRYDIELEVVLKGIAPDVVDGKYFIHWDSAVPMSENNPKDELKYVKSYALLGSDIEDFEVDEEEVEVLNLSGNTQWISTRTKYFGAAVIPQDNVGSGAILRGYQQEYGEEINREYSLSLAMPMGQEQVVSDKFIVFMGPLEYTLINGYNVDLEQMMDFGWKFIRPLAKMIYNLFTFMHNYISNYGIIIILFSIFVKIIFHPLTKKSYISMQAMKELQPKMAAINEKYAKDPQTKNQKVMQLYKEEGVNPLGGCLPLLLQMPVFFAIYPVFYSTIDFRGAAFAGWITDLSLPDYVFSLPFSLPMYGSEVAILPIFMAVSMFVQSAMNLADPKQKMMVYMMPVMMLLFFNNISSGLVLYWSMFNLLALLEQRLIKMWHQSPA